MNRITISKIDIESAFSDFVEGTHYEENENLLKNIIKDKAFMYNTDYRVVALKLGLIDTLYSTNLNKDMATTSVTTIAKIISDPVLDFDNRIQTGDVFLVQDIITNKHFERNNFSLISKYCKIHEYFLSESDNFVIYDRVVATNLYHYLPYCNGKKIVKTNPNRYCFEPRNYILWCDYITQIIADNNLQDIPKVRRKIDWYIWGAHKT